MTMTNLLKKWWKRIRQWVHPPLYVKLDPNDTSVTLSKGLYKHMCLTTKDPSKVMMTKVEGQYAMVVNPPFTEEETAVSDIQYNPKYRSVGFETNCPTVNRVFYDYALEGSEATLLVNFRSVKDMSVYVIRKPRKPKLLQE